MTERIIDQDRVTHLDTVADYYDKVNFFYYVMWHRRAFGLHYGIWLPGVKNRQQAIIKENELLADLSLVKPGDFVLDAGCGVGGSAAWLAKNREARVVGINLSDVQLGGARRIVSEPKFGFNVKNKTDFAKADFHKMPFADNAFNVVWSLESIEHAVSVQDFIEEAYRILKPGGRLVIAATLKGHTLPSEEEQRQLQVGIETSGVFKDSKMGEEVKRMMEDVRFRRVELEDYTSEVLPSAHEITKMCSAWYGQPGLIRFLSKLFPRQVPSVLIMNNEWGRYQESLFETGVTEYDILVGTK